MGEEREIGLRLGAAAALVAAAVLTHPAGLGAQQPPAELRWGGDSEGGAPYVEANRLDPSKLEGFDVDIAAALAAGLGRTPRFVQVQWDQIDSAVLRGDFDIGLSGVEDRPARRARLLTTIPYFEFREVLTVREADRDRFHTLDDLRGRRVGTLGSTLAYEILLNARGTLNIEPISYDDDVHPYTDLVTGRVDAVLLDHIIAGRAMRHITGLVTHPEAVALGHYIGVLAPGN